MMMIVAIKIENDREFVASSFEDKETQSVVVQNKSTKKPLFKQKKQEEKSDSNRDLMQKTLTILEKR